MLTRDFARDPRDEPAPPPADRQPGRASEGSPSRAPRHASLGIGSFVVQPERFLLSRADGNRHLEPKVMGVLLALAAEPGRVVARSRLLDLVWKDKYVTEEVLTRAISQLRRAFGDDARQPRYIETVRQGGYRLVATVTTPADPSEATTRPQGSPPGQAERESPPELGPRQRAAPSRPRLSSLLALGAALLPLAILVPGTHGRGAIESAPGAPPRAIEEGQYFLSRRSATGYQEAIQRFQRALAADPLAAGTHAALAETYLLMGFYRSGAQPVPVAMARARAAAQRSLELDPQQTRARSVLGAVAWTFDYDFASAERHLRAVIADRPSYATGHQWLSWALLLQGRPEEAKAAMDAAARIDPLSAIIATAGGSQALIRGDLPEAERRLRSALAMDPDFARAHLNLGLTLERSGRPDLALAHLERAVSAMGASAEARAAVAHCLASCGRRLEAEEALAGFVAEAPSNGYSSAIEIALLHEVLGRRDEALEWISLGLGRRTILSYWLLLDPRLAGLRSDPRFAELIARTLEGRQAPPLPAFESGAGRRRQTAASGDIGPRGRATAPPGVG